MHPVPTDRQEALLDGLARRLSCQLSKAAENDDDGLAELLAECDVLLGQLAETGEIPGRHAERVDRVRQLHSQLGLVLAQKRDELAGELRHRRQGRKTLRGYRRAGS